MKLSKDKIVHWFIIGIFTTLYFFVATMSMINSVTFFNLAHGETMSWALAIAFEMGAAASLASIIIMEKMNKVIVWLLFWTLTLFQAMSNSFDSWVNLQDYYGWIELFGLTEEEPLFQKRILSVLSGAILPFVALGFIKSLVDYLKPSSKQLEIKEEEIKKKDEEYSDFPLEIENKEKPVEEKLYDSMLNEDKQKILDFIKEKKDIIDKEIEKKIDVPKPEENIEKEIPQPKEDNSKKSNPAPNPSGTKGSKWWGKNRPKNNPV